MALRANITSVFVPWASLEQMSQCSAALIRLVWAPSKEIWALIAFPPQPKPSLFKSQSSAKTHFREFPPTQALIKGKSEQKGSFAHLSGPKEVCPEEFIMLWTLRQWACFQLCNSALCCCNGTIWLMQPRARGATLFWGRGGLSLAQWAFIQTPHEEGPKMELMFYLGWFSVTGKKTEQSKELSAVP